MILSRKNLLRVALALLIGCIGLGLRLDAASRLPIDADEDIYINNALHYAWSVRNGNWKQIYKFDENNQHPALNKLAYAAALLTVDPAEKLQPKDIPLEPVQQTEGKLWTLAARRMAAVLGGLCVFFLALINPLAGLLLAVQTTAIKFTSEVYLESLPLLTSLLVMICYHRWQQGEFANPPRRSRWNLLWLAASAVFLGMTAAGKYIYCVVGLAVLIDFALRLAADRRDLRRRAALMLGWGAFSLVMFLVTNPILWIHTAQRFTDSVLFHIEYSQSWNVKGSYRFWWHPLYLLSRSTADIYPKLQGIFYLDLDLWISLAGLLGAPLLWKRLRPYAVWLFTCAAFLLLWPTKWDQYILIILPALCLAGGELLTWAGRQVLVRRKTLLARKEMAS